jgi:hypothetical protein
MLALLLALVIFGWVGFRFASKSGLNREIEQIRAKGLPTNPKELDAWYSAVPSAENAALKFLEAASVFVAPPRDRNPVDVHFGKIPHTQALDEKTIAILEEHVEKNEETLRLMREAAKMRRSRYPMDLSRAPDIKLDHLGHSRQLALLAHREAMLKAERGDRAGAIEALKNGLAVAHTLAQVPMVISQLNRSALIAVALSAMERAVNVTRFDDAQLAELASKVREASEACRLSLQHALIGERAFENTGRPFTFEEFDALANMGGLVPNRDEVPDILRKVFYYGRRAAGIQEKDHAFYIRSVGRLVDATTLDFPELSKRSEALADEIGAELSDHPLAYEISRLRLLSMVRVPLIEAILTARLRCADMALEIERWRRKNEGRLPREAELASIFEHYPRDPTDGTRLQFQPTGHGGYRVIASAAIAEEKKVNANQNVRDIAFSIER